VRLSALGHVPGTRFGPVVAFEAPSLAVPCLWTGLLLRTAACLSGVTNASPTRQSSDGPTF